MISVVHLMGCQDEIAASIRGELPEYYNDCDGYDYVETLSKLEDICKQEPTKRFSDSVFDKLVAIKVIGKLISERINMEECL